MPALGSRSAGSANPGATDRWWLAFIVLVIAAFAAIMPIQAQAQSQVQSIAASQSGGLEPRTYLVDPTGQMTIDEVRAKPADAFTPFGRALSLGYTADTVWLRLVVDPALADAELGLDSSRLVLRLTNPLLNDVRLYDPLQNNGQPVITGDAHPNTQTELDLSSLTFLLPRGQVAREVYVSVQTTSSMVFSVVLEPIKAALKHNRTYDLFGGVYLGLLVVFLVLAIALRVGRADRVTNMFIAQQSLAIIWSLTLMGYTRQYLEPWLGLRSVDGITNVIVLVYTFSVSLYGMFFLSQFKLRRWAKALVYSPVWVFVPLVAAELLGYTRLALSMNALAIIGFSVLGLVIVLFAIDWKSDAARVLPRWLVTFFFVLFGFATPLATSVTLQVEPVFQNAFVGFFFTTAAGGVLMSSLLLYRARAQAREAITTAMALTLQQQRSAEQAKFLGMIAHEFKTPLSIIKMVVGSGQLDQRSSDYSEDAIRNIDALLEKCLQTEALMDTATVSQPVVLNVEELVRDVVANSHRPGEIEIRGSGQTDINSDPTLVRIVLANLVDNALKYGKPGSLVNINLSGNTEQTVCVRVTNSVGRSGVPDPEHVFDKYYRSPGALSQSGSGLGLYLSKHIAKLLGGDLLFEPSKDELWFEVRLPRQL
ncbi:MAG: ATP-binding protein [Burkholderiaceae bacterium]|nr:ATP-binding protein [Burkholderiaceae bacterium]